MKTLTLKRTKVSLDDQRREIITQNIHLVKMIASKIAIFLPKHIDYEDLIHEGLVGLMDAAIKFDDKQGMKFASYAVIRIKGAILDSLRSLDWIPRRIRKLAKTIEKAREDLQHELRREPSEEEISGRLGITPQKYRQIVSDVEHAHMLSYEDLQSFTSRYYLPEDKYSTVNQAFVVSDFERIDIKEQLKFALKDLSEREKLVLSLYYVEDLTLKEIKHVMNISEARISQIHTSALKKLRESINRAAGKQVTEK